MRPSGISPGRPHRSSRAAGDSLPWVGGVPARCFRRAILISWCFPTSRPLRSDRSSKPCCTRCGTLGCPSGTRSVRGASSFARRARTFRRAPRRSRPARSLATPSGSGACSTSVRQALASARGGCLATIAERPRPGTPYALEPDLKEDAGGRRDFDELVWIAAIASGSVTRSPQALVGDGTRHPGRGGLGHARRRDRVRCALGTRPRGTWPAHDARRGRVLAGSRCGRGAASPRRDRDGALEGARSRCRRASPRSSGRCRPQSSLHCSMPVSPHSRPWNRRRRPGVSTSSLRAFESS